MNTLDMQKNLTWHTGETFVCFNPGSRQFNAGALIDTPTMINIALLQHEELRWCTLMTELRSTGCNTYLQLSFRVQTANRR